MTPRHEVEQIIDALLRLQSAFADANLSPPSVTVGDARDVERIMARLELKDVGRVSDTATGIKLAGTEINYPVRTALERFPSHVRRATDF